MAALRAVIFPGSLKKVADTANKNYNNWRLVNSLASGVYPFKNFKLNAILKNCYKTANVKNRTELRKYAVSQLSTWYED